MAEGLTKYFYTTKEIAEVWKKEGWLREKDKAKDRDQLADSIARRFKSILDKMGFKDEINWYMSESSNGGSGYYIFNPKSIPENAMRAPQMKKYTPASGSTPQALKAIMDVFEDTKGWITAKEKDRLINDLVDILPVFRNSKEYDKAMEERIDMESPLEKEKWEEFRIHSERISEKVKSYYDKQEKEIFKNRFFFNIDATKIRDCKIRGKMYAHQYGLVRDWYVKWNFCMRNAEIIRKAEGFDNLFKISKMSAVKRISKNDTISEEELCEGLLKIFALEEVKGEQETKLWKIECAEKIEEARGENEKTKDGCEEKCDFLVNKLLSHSLKNTFEKDFEYMKKMAFEELERILEEMLQIFYLESYKSQAKGGREEDLYKLFQIRHMVEKIREKKRNTEYLELLKSIE